VVFNCPQLATTTEVCYLDPYFLKCLFGIQDLAKSWTTSEILVPLQAGERGFYFLFHFIGPDSLCSPNIRLLGSYKEICV